MSIIPKSRPQASRDELSKLVAAHGLDITKEKVVIVGDRGYYKRTMGNPLTNDRGVYDDAIFVITEKGMTAFNGNVDPSIYRKGIATLVCGAYKVVKWMHKGKYRALQIVQDCVARDGSKNLDTGRHGINIHYGGEHSTSSEGCQTLPRNQFLQFQGLVYELMDDYGLKQITYLLVEN